jgi:hypothetical protein
MLTRRSFTRLLALIAPAAWVGKGAVTVVDWFELRNGSLRLAKSTMLDGTVLWEAPGDSPASYHMLALDGPFTPTEA